MHHDLPPQQAAKRSRHKKISDLERLKKEKEGLKRRLERRKMIRNGE